MSVMRLGFIGDIVGRPGRAIIKNELMTIKERFALDFIVGNYENASHGFGLTTKNFHELLNSGINAMTGGNHTWDKKEIIPLLDREELMRPLNYPKGVPGSGLRIYEVSNQSLAVINLMGVFTLPALNNPFIEIEELVKRLHDDGIKNIVIDFHAEATSEKRALFMMLHDRVSLIYGTHTHVGSDDAQIISSCGYCSDIGLTGCRDNVIGMEEQEPISRFKTGISGHFNVPNRCKSMLQMLIAEVDEGACRSLKKLKYFDDGREIVTDAWQD